jgi:hypothetical protein
MMWIFLATGCVTEDSFVEQYARVGCIRARECNKGFFQAEYDNDIGECVDDALDYYDDVEDYYDDCDFDEDNARECLAQLRSDSCGDLYEDGVGDCNHVWRHCD